MISILVYNALSYVGGIKCVMPLIFQRLIRELGEIGAWLKYSILSSNTLILLELIS